MERKKVCGIYKITNKVNGKIYIGQSIDIYRRWVQEKEGLCNSHLLNAFKKYGTDNFIFEILEECCIEELDEKEIYYISFYNSANPSKGYNKTFGGQENHFLSDETKRKISVKHKGKHLSEIAKKKLSKLKKGIPTNQIPWNKGKKASKEVREKLSISHKGQIPPNRKKVLCIETNIIYDSIAEATRKTGIHNSAICLVCNGKRNSAGGFHWQFI